MSTYYISKTDGSDSDDGLSIDAAWETLTKVGAETFSPGDRVLFRAGDVWRESLVVPSSGDGTNQLVFGSYGSGDKPLFSGSDLVTTWTDLGSNRWEASLGTGPFQVFMNGTRGQQVGSVALILAPGDWFYAAGDLTIYSTYDPDDAFTGPGVEASVRTAPIWCQTHPYVDVQDIAVKHANQSTAGAITFALSAISNLRRLTVYDCMGYGGIAMSNSDQCSVDACEVYNQTHSNVDFGIGLILEGADTTHVHDNILRDNQSNGIRAAITPATGSSFNTIEYNQVYGNGNAGISMIGDGTTTASNLIQYNTVYDNCGITADRYNIGLFQCGNNNIVRRNTVYGANYISTDAGGIRFDGGFGVGTFGTGNLCYQNVIYDERNGIHVLEADSVTVNNNTVDNSDQIGIWVNNSGATGLDNTTVKNNIVHNSGVSHIVNDAATNSDIDYNLYYPDTGTRFDWNGTDYDFADWKTNSSQDGNSPDPADPLLTGIRSLAPTSPAIDVGLNVGLTEDIVGTSLPQFAGYDIGAHEFPGTTRHKDTALRSNDTSRRHNNQTLRHKDPTLQSNY